MHDFDGTSSGPAGGGPNQPTGSIVPRAELVEGADGSLYGVRVNEGDQGKGIVFRYTAAGTAPLFCPNAFVRRDQMAVFLLKTEHGFDHRSARLPWCLSRRQLSLALRRLDRGARLRRHHGRLRRR